MQHSLQALRLRSLESIPNMDIELGVELDIELGVELGIELAFVVC